jgi:hypothetical protein
MAECSHLSKDRFVELIGHERQRSFAASGENRNLLETLLGGTAEISLLLDQLYRSNAPGRTVIVSRACGGCQVHRRIGAVGVGIHYSAPPAYGIERAGAHDLSAFMTRFPQLDLRGPVILPVDEPCDDATVIAVLKDFVSMFGVREIATTTAFRKRNATLSTLHKHSGNQMLLLQSIEEEAMRPSSYRLPRVSLWTDHSGTRAPDHLFTIQRPMHVIIVRESTPDPCATGRRIADTGLNVLRADQFKIGARS